MSVLASLVPTGAEFPSANFAPGVVNNRPVIAFDATANEVCLFSDQAPATITGNISLALSFIMASATTGNVTMLAAIEAVAQGDALTLSSSTSFGSDNSNTVTVPATAGNLGQMTIAMSANDSLAAGDYFRVRLTRNAADDSAAGDFQFLSALLLDEG